MTWRYVLVRASRDRRGLDPVSLSGRVRIVGTDIGCLQVNDIHEGYFTDDEVLAITTTREAAETARRLLT